MALVKQKNEFGLTPQREHYAQEIAANPQRALWESFIMAFPKAKVWTKKTIYARASELWRDERVQKRVKMLREVHCPVNVLSKEEAATILSVMARDDMRPDMVRIGAIKTIQSMLPGWSATDAKPEETADEVEFVLQQPVNNKQLPQHPTEDGELELCVEASSRISQNEDDN